MNKEELKNTLQGLFPEATLSESTQFNILTVPADKLPETAQRLKEDSALAFDFLFCLTGEDWPGHFMVTYHLRSTQYAHEMVLKATISKEKPEIETLTPLYATAELNEREAMEMYGITFLHHPDPRKLLLPDNWEGYPMRKDYYDPIHIVELD